MKWNLRSVPCVRPSWLRRWVVLFIFILRRWRRLSRQSVHFRIQFALKFHACGQQSCSNAVPWVMSLNWVAQVCLVATDKAIADSIMAEKVASVYGFRLLHEAYQVSKQGETELCGLRNVADVLSTIDWAGVRRVWDEIQSIPSPSGPAVVRKDLSADRPFYCLKALFNKCTSSYCKGSDLIWCALAAPVPAATELPPALPSFSVVYHGFKKFGCNSLAFASE